MKRGKSSPWRILHYFGDHWRQNNFWDSPSHNSLAFYAITTTTTTLFPLLEDPTSITRIIIIFFKGFKTTPALSSIPKISGSRYLFLRMTDTEPEESGTEDLLDVANVWCRRDHNYSLWCQSFDVCVQEFLLIQSAPLELWCQIMLRIDAKPWTCQSVALKKNNFTNYLFPWNWTYYMACSATILRKMQQNNTPWMKLKLPKHCRISTTKTIYKTKSLI